MNTSTNRNGNILSPPGLPRTFFILRCLLALVVLVIIQAPSFSQSSHPLEGSWQVDLAASIEMMSTAVRSKFDSLHEDVKARAEASMGSRIFSFQPSGAVTVSWTSKGIGRSVSGTWQTSGTVLSLTVDGGTQQFSFELATDQHLILRNTAPGGLFSNLYLTRQP